MSQHLDVLCEQVCQIARNTGAFLRHEIDRVTADRIEEKAMNSLVSYVDKQAEHQLVQALSVLLPEAGFITEEETIAQEQRDFTWIIDPLDGTTNYLHRIPHYAISIALKQGADIVIGVVLEAARDEIFYTWKGGGAYRNGHRMEVSSIDRMDQAILATGFPYEASRKLDLVEYLSSLLRRVRGIRRMGSAALDLAYVACGRFEAYYEATLNPWDVAAGALLVQEAGGMVTDFSGGDNYVFGRQIVASNGHLHLSIRRFLEQIAEPQAAVSRDSSKKAR